MKFSQIESLKQGDPQALAVLAGIAFSASVCWFSWTLLFPAQPDAPPGSGIGQRPVPVPTSVSLQEMLAAQREIDPPTEVLNPFFKSAPPRRTRGNRRNQNDGNDEATADKPSEPDPADGQETENPRATASAPPEPTTRLVEVQYRGMLTRPDRTTVGLIAMPGESREEFIAVGDSLFGHEVMGISPEGIALQEGNGPMEVVPRGETKSIEVPL